MQVLQQAITSIEPYLNRENIPNFYDFLVDGTLLSVRQLVSGEIFSDTFSFGEVIDTIPYIRWEEQPIIGICIDNIFRQGPGGDMRDRQYIFGRRPTFEDIIWTYIRTTLTSDYTKVYSFRDERDILLTMVRLGNNINTFISELNNFNLRMEGTNAVILVIKKSAMTLPHYFNHRNGQLDFQLDPTFDYYRIQIEPIHEDPNFLTIRRGRPKVPGETIAATDLTYTLNEGTSKEKTYVFPLDDDTKIYELQEFESKEAILMAPEMHAERRKASIEALVDDVIESFCAWVEPHSDHRGPAYIEDTVPDPENDAPPNIPFPHPSPAANRLTEINSLSSPWPAIDRLMDIIERVHRTNEMRLT